MPCVYLPGPAPAVTVANKKEFKDFTVNVVIVMYGRLSLRLNLPT